MVTFRYIHRFLWIRIENWTDLKDNLILGCEEMEKTNQTFKRLQPAMSVFHYLCSILSFQKSVSPFINYFRIVFPSRSSILTKMFTFSVLEDIMLLLNLKVLSLWTDIEHIHISIKAFLFPLNAIVGGRPWFTLKKDNTVQEVCKKTTSYVSMFSCLHSTYIPLDTCRCRRHHCWYNYAGSCGLGHMNLKLEMQNI